MPFVTGYISKAERIDERFQVDIDASRSQFEEVHTNSKGYMSDRISCFKSHKQYGEIMKVAAMAQLEDTLIKIEYVINGDYLNFANKDSTNPATITIVTDKADVPVVTKSAPQRTETPKNDPGLSGGAKDRDIHWQVAIKAAIDILRISQTKAIASENFSGLDDWTYEFLGKAANKIYTLIEDGPRPIVVEDESEPLPVFDLGDDDDPQALMEV
tara:strand:+ start:237 stop:878 length:642 start_codon:yes stop_codon:yes gene_type:complete